MNIIGINGFKRSGKGEVGKAIAELSLGVHQLGFADKLKVFAARSLGYTQLSDAECIALMDRGKELWVADLHEPAIVDGPDGPLLDQRHHIKTWTVRQLLQYMGTEARTVFCEDFWVDQVLPKPISAREQYQGSASTEYTLKNRYPGAATLAFTDLRFENEARRIIDLGGFNLEVVRPGVTSDGHASELVLDRRFIKYVVSNDGTLADLRWEVDKVLEAEGLMPGD